MFYVTNLGYKYVVVTNSKSEVLKGGDRHANVYHIHRKVIFLPDL